MNIHLIDDSCKSCELQGKGDYGVSYPCAGV